MTKTEKREFREIWASDPNKFKSGVYTSKPMEGENIDFKQTLFIEKSAYEQLQKENQELKAKVQNYEDALKITLTQNRTRGYPTNKEWESICVQHTLVLSKYRKKEEYEKA